MSSRKSCSMRFQRRVKPWLRLRCCDEKRGVRAKLRSEEHTSELQSLRHLVCRLLLDPAPTDIYTLSPHDALPICCSMRFQRRVKPWLRLRCCDEKRGVRAKL